MFTLLLSIFYFSLSSLIVLFFFFFFFFFFFSCLVCFVIWVLLDLQVYFFVFVFLIFFPTMVRIVCLEFSELSSSLEFHLFFPIWVFHFSQVSLSQSQPMKIFIWVFVIWFLCCLVNYSYLFFLTLCPPF